MGSTVKDDTQIEGICYVRNCASDESLIAQPLVESEMINDVDGKFHAMRSVFGMLTDFMCVVSDNDSIATASDCTNVDEHNEDDCYMDTPSKPTQMRSANTPSKYKPYHNTNATPCIYATIFSFGMKANMIFRQTFRKEIWSWKVRAWYV